MSMGSTSLGDLAVSDQRRTLAVKHQPPPTRQAIAEADAQARPAPDPQ